MINDKQQIGQDLKWAHPIVQEWFISKLGHPTEPQKQGWPHILNGNSTLISAPTGSGKTLTAFLACLDQLVRKALSGELKNQTEVLYISPLKALGNDIQKNLMGPLKEISELAASKKLPMAEIQVAVRTGDTLMRERQAMLKKPPHILVTTPESLYILLTAEKSRQMLKSIKTVIVDEIHAMANDKRGAHLLLSLERLAVLTHQEPIRIGLSATQKPIEKMAQFLAGKSRPLPKIVNIGHARHLELKIQAPITPLGPVASNEMWDEIYDQLADLVKENRSTLVFVNTRRLAERVAHHLAERLGEEVVAAHHGSLARKLRLTAETKLKAGELKVLVATASLELGIDIGSIDLVCQVGSPRSIAVMLQRIGRAGHWHGAISKGRLIATTRDELVECAALVWAIQQGDLDQLVIPVEPIDILSQQIVAICATGDWQEDDLYALIKKAYPYRHLAHKTFDEVIEMLSEGIAGSRGRYSSYLFRDQVNNVVKARRGSRLTAITNGGAIPENGLFTVIAEPQEVMVGTLDEDFAVESNRGDIILLGTTSWKVLRVESKTGKIFVEDAHGAPPSVPFWRGEAPARTDELSFQVSEIRIKISSMLALNENVIEWLIQHAGLKKVDAEQLISYLQEGRAVLGEVPTQKTIIAERFFDEGGGMQLVIHAPFGARINKAWGLALRKCFCRSFNFELQAAATDNGISIALAEQHSFPLGDVFQFLHPNTLKKVLTQAVLQSPLFATRWRWDAGRALALVRFRHGKKIPPNIQRMLADDLLAAVFPDAAACQDNLGGRDIELPEHPLIAETMKDALTEALDIEGLATVLNSIIQDQIKCLAVDTPTPSAFAHEILNANPYAFLDDAPLEERRARAVEMRRFLPSDVLETVGKLDPEVIREVQLQAWPDIRSTDELHDSLQTFIAFPEEITLGPAFNLELWKSFFQQLQAEKRAFLLENQNQKFWVAAEKLKSFTAAYPHVLLPKEAKEIEKEQPSYEAALQNLLRGWLFHLGPITFTELSSNLGLPLQDIEPAILQLESTGLILRGKFRENIDETEWCERRLLARIHKLTLGKLRKMIEPVQPQQFMGWLMKWQHRAPENQLSGEQGLIEIIKKLQGYELPANAWEKEIFSKRLKDYDPDMLDRLCLAGIIGWCRLSPHPATLPQENPSPTKKSRVTPTSIVPITFFIREESFWMFETKEKLDDDLTGLSSIAQKIFHYLKQRGAAFFTDIVRGTGHLKAEIETGLWELVAAGKISADDFDNLRGLIDPRRRLRKKNRRGLRFEFSRGRWTLLHPEKMTDPAHHVESACWMLLKRYGVVFRDLLEREKNIPTWRELLFAFRRLEDRGEIRGGRFVSGFAGEQFALPYCIDSLRASKDKILPENITISAVDPLNLVGIILPGSKVGAISGKEVILT
jgi:ATP-dependent helicase Lhr and Lhr-like helicase